MSSQIGWPEGASAECPSDRPSASPITCEVAAVPRNWQPPPGDAQARQPSSDACSSESSPWTNRTPIVCTRPASSPSRGSSVTPPGTSTHGRSWLAGERHHHGGQPLVARGDAEDAATRRERSNQAAEDRGGVVAIGEAVEHRRRALRTAIAGIGARGREGDGARALELVRRGLHEQADFPVPGVIAESDRRSVRRADAAVRREDEELFAADGGRLPAHPGVLRPAEDVARGA